LKLTQRNHFQPSENKLGKPEDCGRSGEVPSKAGDGGEQGLNDDDGTGVGDETNANPHGAENRGGQTLASGSGSQKARVATESRSGVAGRVVF
jgi:hypothetical protein